MTNIGGNMFGVQPGTGKWVSAQRGKPQIDGPVSVAATAPAPAATPTETAMAPGEPGKFAFPEKKLDRSGREPEAMITHHTSGGPKETPQGIVNWWKQQGKGLGSQYIQDREGRIWDTAKELGWNKTAHAMPAGIYRGNTMTSRFPEGDPRRNLSNANTVGIEVMASNDKGVKEVQAREFAKFMAARYPKTQMFGHGEINVNRKEKDEGITVKNAAYAYRAQLAAKAKENSSVDLANARKDDTSLQASIDRQPKPKTRSFIPADDAHNKRMEEHRETTKALKGGGEAEAEAPKSRPSDDLIMASQRDVNVNLKVNDSSMQFARASMARQADVEMRKARQNHHGDIGVA
jgi:N-acetyl-anhydromuramyl-L-alanine amidase AmpD